MNLHMEGKYVVVVKQFTNIPINHGPFKEKNEIASNFTEPVFLLCHLLINASESLAFPKNSDRNQSYFNLQKDFQNQKLIIFFFFPPQADILVFSITS